MQSKIIKNDTFSFFEEENVSANVANNEITILHVISHDKVMLWNSLWPTAAFIFFYPKYYWKICVFRSFYKKKKYGKMH